MPCLQSLSYLCNVFLDVIIPKLEQASIIIFANITKFISVIVININFSIQFYCFSTVVHNNPLKLTMLLSRLNSYLKEAFAQATVYSKFKILLYCRLLYFTLLSRILLMSSLYTSSAFVSQRGPFFHHYLLKFEIFDIKS